MSQLPPPGAPVFRGARVSRHDPRYQTLIRGFNQRWLGNPLYVQLCATPEQVRAAVQEAVRAGLRITVRGGGHCYEDFVSDNHDGVIVDLSALNAVYRSGSLYAVEGGCTLWNVYSQLYKEHGVTIPGGSCYSTGAGGHIVGGGYGLLSRLYGLTVDYLHEVELVHVDRHGRAELIRVRRDATDPAERDLFWAHQGGGGGNFGVVTRYWFADLPPAPETAYLQSAAWEWADFKDPAPFKHLVTAFGEFFARHSGVGSPYSALFALLHLTRREAGQIVLAVQNVGQGPEPVDELLRAVNPFDRPPRAQRVPVGHHYSVPRLTPEIQMMPWLEATQSLNSSGPNRRGKYKSAYMKRPFPSRQIETLWTFLTDQHYQNPNALLQVDSYGCQVNAVGRQETAIPQRSSVMKLQYQTYWTDPREDDKHLAWIRDFYTRMYGPDGPLPDGTMDGCYVNYPDTDLKNWQLLYYGENYPRLQQAKARWDPLNVFHHKQSIELPAAPGS